MTVLLPVALLLAFQGPQVSAELDRERVGLGEAITLTIRAVVERGAPVRAEIPDFDGFALIGQSDRREVGGPSLASDVYILELRLRAQQTGLWRLGPVRLELADVTITAPEVEVGVEAGGPRAGPTLGPRVLAMLNRAQPPAAGDVAVTLMVSGDSVLVGEQVDVVTAAWFPRELLARLRRPPTLRPPSIDGVYNAVQPSSAGVAASRNVGGVWYDLWVAHQVIFPVSEGEVQIPPAGLAFSVPAGRQYFSEERNYSLTSSTRSLHVRPLPPGGPGPVARELDLAWSLRPETARAGEPLRVDLVLRGTGNSALWPRPAVPWPDGSRGYAEAVDDQRRVVAGIVGGSRHFRFVVIADSAGSLALPEIHYDYFDPERGWRQAMARPVVLPVQPARPLDRQRPAPVLLEQEPVSLTRLTGWPLAVLLLLILAPPLLVALARRRPRAVAVTTPARDPGERLQAAVRAVVPDPDRRREPRLVGALREQGFDARTSAEIARVYGLLAVRRFAPRGDPAAASADREAAQLLRQWPRRLGRALTVLAGLGLLVKPLPAQSEADSMYREGRYAAAATLYARDAAAVPTSARAWFAAGAAAWAAGQDASAASAWLAALRLAPRSPDVRQAWGQVSRLSADLQRVGRVPPLTPAELGLAAALVWALAWGALGLTWRRTGVALLVAAAAIGVVAASTARRYQQPIAVLSRAAQLRDAPHGLAEEIGRAEVLAVVDLLERRGGWRLVGAGTGQRGWLPASALAEVRPLDSRP